MSRLILEDGSVYEGQGFGAEKTVVCEVVFNTSMVGYQEILSDPSYTDQAVVMSYPLMGNYGITDEDFESRIIAPSAFLVRDINESPSNFCRNCCWKTVCRASAASTPENWSGASGIREPEGG